MKDGDRLSVVPPGSSLTDEEVQVIVKADREFRRKLGLRTDQEHVEALVRAFDYATGVPRFSFAATPDEEAELALRDQLGDEVGALEDELRATRPADFGGAYVDPQTGRAVVWSVGDRITREDVADRLSSPDRLEIRTARFSADRLDEASRQTALLFEQFYKEGLLVTSAGADWFTNRLELTVADKTDRAAVLRMLEAVGIEPEMVSFRGA